MSKINQLLKHVAEVMQMQKTDAEELLKFEGKMEAVINSAKPNSIEQLIAAAYLVSAKQMRIYNDAIVSIYGSFLTLLSEQEKEINTLKEAITSSTSLEELSQKVERSVTEKLRKDYEDIQDFINRWKEEQEHLKKEQERQKRAMETYVG